MVPTAIKNIANTSRDGDSPKLPVSIRLEVQMRGGGGGIKRGRRRKRNSLGDGEEEIEEEEGRDTEEECSGNKVGGEQKEGRRRGV